MVQRLPDEVSLRARHLLDGSWTPPAARDAATVVLLRDAASGPQVLLTRRPRTMAFAPGMHVFPGGRVDIEHDSSVPVVGEVPGGDWSPDPRLARAIAAAGVRETFEEVGLLLAVDPQLRPPPGDDRAWDEDRWAIAADPGSMAAVLDRRGLVVHARALVPIAHWVTPEVESRRFDTRFLAARAPADQRVHPHATEIVAAEWIRPGQALEEHLAGLRPMLPPTLAVLRTLAGARDVGAVLARSGLPTPTMPRPAPSTSGITWNLVHAYTGEVLGPSAEPAGSEVVGQP